MLSEPLENVLLYIKLNTNTVYKKLFNLLEPCMIYTDTFHEQFNNYPLGSKGLAFHRHAVMY